MRIFGLNILTDHQLLEIVENFRLCDIKKKQENIRDSTTTYKVLRSGGTIELKDVDTLQSVICEIEGLRLSDIKLNVVNKGDSFTVTKG
jgi:hypothetical protein